jgi:hypothetical protein
LKKQTGIESASKHARREQRIQHLSDLHLTYEGESREIAVRPPDLSTHGMFVNTSKHFPEGAIVILRFRLTQSNVEVQARCEVRYCLSGVGIGVEFVRLGPEAFRAIENELRLFFRARQSTRKWRTHQRP